MPNATRAAYDTIAAEYAALQTDAPPAELIPFAEQLLARLPPGTPLLDLGCGPGRDLSWLAARGARGMGCALSMGMLAAARARSGGPLVQADMRRLPFPGGTFGAIWCCASFLHLPKADAPGALGEMRRVLVPGGTLFLGVQEGSGEGWEVYGWEVARFFARYTSAEVATLLSGAGFTVLAQERGVHAQRTWLQFLATAQAATKTGGGAA
jgi:SAM-dependent methyltransferase